MSFSEIVKVEKKSILSLIKGKEIAEKELIRLRELVGIASGIVGGTL